MRISCLALSTSFCLYFSPRKALKTSPQKLPIIESSRESSMLNLLHEVVSIFFLLSGLATHQLIALERKRRKTYSPLPAPLGFLITRKSSRNEKEAKCRFRANMGLAAALRVGLFIAPIYLSIVAPVSASSQAKPSRADPYRTALSNSFSPPTS